MTNMLCDEKPNWSINQWNPVKMKYKHMRKELGWKHLKKEKFKNDDTICGSVGLISPYGIVIEEQMTSTAKYNG